MARIKMIKKAAIAAYLPRFNNIAKIIPVGKEYIDYNNIHRQSKQPFFKSTKLYWLNTNIAITLTQKLPKHKISK